MPQRDEEISRIYLELAVECFGKAAPTHQLDTASALKRMAHRHLSHAFALNPSLSEQFAYLNESIGFAGDRGAGQWGRSWAARSAPQPGPSAAFSRFGGILEIENRPRFREYVVREHRPTYRYSDEVRLGAVLPGRGVRFYEVPAEYHVRPGYRYTIVNERPVIVEPRSRRIVEIIE